MTATHELHWVPEQQRFTIVATHPMTPGNGCGWVGRPVTRPSELTALWEHVRSVATRLDESDPEEPASTPQDYFRDKLSGAVDLDGISFRVSSEGDIMVVEHWCAFAQADLWGVDEMIERAKWSGNKGASIPVAAITEWMHNDGPRVTKLGPITETDAEWVAKIQSLMVEPDDRP